jgi:hypothetical protein
MWQSMNSGDIAGMVVACGICVTIIIAKAIKARRESEESRLAAQLKMEMIARGMSADEIERVLAARLSVDSSLAATRAYAEK